MPSDKIKIKGSVQVFKGLPSDKNKKLIADVDNLLMTVGKQKILEVFCGLETDVFEYIAVGSDATPPIISQTTLVTELHRNVAAKSRTGTTLYITAVFLAGEGTGTWNETGLFNDSVTGSMSNRAVFSIPVTKGGADIYSVRWTLSM